MVVMALIFCCWWWMSLPSVGGGVVLEKTLLYLQVSEAGVSASNSLFIEVLLFSLSCLFQKDTIIITQV